jgi:hypothetical protein
MNALYSPAQILNEYSLYSGFVQETYSGADFREFVPGVASTQPCRILLRGSTLHLLHADFLDPLLRAAGFSWDQSGKAYVKRAIEVACMVEAASVLDITAEAVVEAVQSTGSQTQCKGAGWPSFRALRVSVDDRMVHLSGPPGIMEHARSMGFQPAHQSALKLGVRQVAINNNNNNEMEMNKERVHEREFKLGMGLVAMDNEMNTAINDGMNAINNERAHQRALTLRVGQVELKMGVCQVAQLMAADFHTAFRHASSSSLSSSSLSSASASPPPDGDAAEPRANRKAEPEQDIQAAAIDKNAPAAQGTDINAADINAADIKAGDTGKSASGAQDEDPEQDTKAEDTNTNTRATCDARDDEEILLQHVTPQAVVALIQRSIETLAEKVARGSSAPASKPQIRFQNDEVQVLNAYDVKDMLRSLGFTWNTESACWRMDAMQLLERMQAHELSAITIDDILALEPGTSATLTKEPPRLEISDGEALVFNSYFIKEKLRALGFRWDSGRSVWANPVDQLMATAGVQEEAQLTIDMLLKLEPVGPSGEPKKPYITCDDDQVCVFDSYEVKDKLKALSFRFDSARAVWSRPTAEVLSLLALDDKADISIQRLLECSAPEVGATDEDGNLVDAAGASLEMLNDEV